MELPEFVRLLQEDQRDDGAENLFEPPAAETEIEEWEEEHPEFTLPDTYKELLRMANGFTIHASSESPNGRLRLLPLAEVKPLADQVMEICGLDEEDLTDPPACLMVGEDQDTQWCLGLDTETGHYLEVDYTGVTTDLGTLPSMLDWVMQKIQPQ